MKETKRQVYSDKSKERIVHLQLEIVEFLKLVHIDFLNDQQKQGLINLQSKMKEMAKIVKNLDWAVYFLKTNYEEIEEEKNKKLNESDQQKLKLLLEGDKETPS